MGLSKALPFAYVALFLALGIAWGGLTGESLPNALVGTLVFIVPLAVVAWGVLKGVDEVERNLLVIIACWLSVVTFIALYYLAKSLGINSFFIVDATKPLLYSARGLVAGSAFVTFLSALQALVTIRVRRGKTLALKDERKVTTTP